MIQQIRLGISNVFLVKGTKPILVDAGKPTEANRIVMELEKLGVQLGDLALLIISHAHWDHCGAAGQLRQSAKLPIAIHEADADQMRRGSNGILKPTCLTARLARPFLDRAYPLTEPDILMTDDFDLSPFGVPGRVISTPGHTAGSVSVLLPTDDAIVGDLLMGGYLGGKIFPRVPTYHYYAEDFEMLKTSLNRLMREHSPSRVYVGHGGPLEGNAIRNRLMT